MQPLLISSIRQSENNATISKLIGKTIEESEDLNIKGNN